MHKKFSLLSVLGATLILSACEGDDGAPGATGDTGAEGEAGFNSLVVVREIEVGDAACLGGGIALDSGLDTNRNGELDAGEITDTFISECAVTPVLRALHASADAPDVNILVDGADALSGVPFPAGSGFLPVGLADNVTEEGVSIDVVVNALLPDESEVLALSAGLDLSFDTETTVIATGDVEDGLPLTPIVVTNPLGEEIAGGSFRVQVVHGADDAPPVNVYVTPVDGELVSPVNGDTPLAFGSFTPQLEVAADTYRIRIEADIEGTPTVVYDSGSDGIPLAAGADLMIVAVDNAFIGESPVELVVLDGTASSSIPDANIGAAALAVHLSPDAGAVDILADVDATPEDEALKLVDNATYGAFCVAGENIAPGAYTLNVVATGDTTSLLPIPYNAVVGEATAVAVTGFAGSQTLQAIDLPIPTRSIATEAGLRLTHASPSTGNVDIYLLAAGGDINAEDPDFTDVAFGASTPLLSLAPNTYDVYVTGTGSKDPAISVTGFLLEGGDNYDVFARDAIGEETLPQAVAINYDDDLDLCIPET